MSAVTGLPPQPPSRLDILGTIHGGLLGHEFAAVLKAARDVGAAVVPVDRPQAAIRSRIGQILWHPRMLQGLLHFGQSSVNRRSTAKPEDGEALRKELEEACPPAHRVLVEERSTCMAQQIRTVAVPNEEVFVVCGVPQLGALTQALSRPPQQGGADELARLAKRFVPVWPLYALGYVVIPGGLMLYGAAYVVENIVAPALDFEVAGEPSGPVPVTGPPPTR